MRYNRLGNTGLFVSELCLGTMTFGGKGFFEYMGAVGQEDADQLLRAAVEAGVNFIDTANVYSQGLSEEITGQAIRNLGLRRDQVVLATKVLGPMGDGPNDAGTSRYHIMEQAKASLKRLGTDHIDLYQLHGWDPATPIEEALRALDDLVRQGHVRYIGVSNWAAWQIAKALGMSAARGWERFQTTQCYYSVAGRDLEREIVPMIRSEGIGLLVWSPLAGGYLSGKYRAGNGDGRRDVRPFPPVDDALGHRVLDAMDSIAQARGISVAQVALAWLLHQPHVTSVIVGAKRGDQLQDNLASVKVELTADDLKTLDDAGSLAPEYPGWMIARMAEYRALLNQTPHGA
ncbi:MAG: aldo/keto reductase [Pigmentiphaga sp.]|uniref:aldo/keto reductase n=1 Tax=Pigmentiphaga sp. TaxID=1977564 RepID=UPI0029B57769|nr:aldo/keto reductase [Pigmentiphaga sp.]MDX3905570.1 aldo/keto reductase [Pigmentiphaga sp.]